MHNIYAIASISAMTNLKRTAITMEHTFSINELTESPLLVFKSKRNGLECKQYNSQKILPPKHRYNQLPNDGIKVISVSACDKNVFDQIFNETSENNCGQHENVDDDASTTSSISLLSVMMECDETFELNTRIIRKEGVVNSFIKQMEHITLKLEHLLTQTPANKLEFDSLDGQISYLIDKLNDYEETIKFNKTLLNKLSSLIDRTHNIYCIFNNN